MVQRRLEARLGEDGSGAEGLEKAKKCFGSSIAGRERKSASAKEELFHEAAQSFLAASKSVGSGEDMPKGSLSRSEC